MADLKRHEELVVITKTYDLILWSCQHTGRFPRNHRFVLGERIERNLYATLRQARLVSPRNGRGEVASRFRDKSKRISWRNRKRPRCPHGESYLRADHANLYVFAFDRRVPTL